MGIFKKFIKFIKTRGVSDNFPKENQLTEMLNIMSLITAAGSFFLLLFTIYYTTDFVYMFLAGMVTVLYSGIIILHHFHKIHEARFYFATIHPFWYVISMLFIGGYFGQDIACCATITICYLQYYKRKKLRNKLIAFNIVIFIIPTIYVGYNDPLFGLHEYPFDEIIVFLCCIGWMSILYFSHEEKARNYIKSLAHKNAELKEKTSDLERFAYIASHDLKSPLNNISNFLNLMEKDLDRKKYNNLNTYLKYTRNSAVQMDELIDGVNTISSSDNGENHMDWKMVNLNETLDKVVMNLHQELKKKNGFVEKKNELPTIRCNEADFIIVFQNLIQNGLKYNESNAPNITIDNKSSDNLINIEFTDNGIGIAEKHFKEIFEYFKRLHNQKIYKGSGLGLGLCKKIISKYNGTLKVESEIDVYSTFIISIPLLEEQQKVGPDTYDDALKLMAPNEVF